MILTSPKNEWIQQLRRLHQAKGRREQGCFLVEGTHLIQEALSTSWPLPALCYTPLWQEHHPQILTQIPSSTRQQPVSEAVLQRLTTTETPDGVVGVARHLPPADPAEISLGVAVETLQDPGNLGALIRNSVAAGSEVLWISADSVDPEHPKVLRSSAGQWFKCPPRSVDDLRALIQLHQQQGIRVLAACAQPISDRTGTLWDWDLTVPTIFLLGNEGAGLSQTLIDQADGTIQIPMAAGVESLNLAMTGGLLLYEAKRQRQALESTCPDHEVGKSRSHQ